MAERTPERVKLTAVIDGDLHAETRRIAAAERRSLNAEINVALEEHARRYNQTKEGNQ